MTKEFTLKSSPFDWNDNFSEVAIEDFDNIRDKLGYGTCQSIGMALAKLEMLEKQGCKVVKSQAESEDEMDDEKRFCRKCNWNDCDYGCTCPSNEEVYQCPMYMHYHPDEVKEFDKAMEEWASTRQKVRMRND